MHSRELHHPLIAKCKCDGTWLYGWGVMHSCELRHPLISKCKCEGIWLCGQGEMPSRKWHQPLIAKWRCPTKCKCEGTQLCGWLLMPAREQSHQLTTKGKYESTLLCGQVVMQFKRMTSHFGIQVWVRGHSALWAMSDALQGIDITCWLPSAIAWAPWLCRQEVMNSSEQNYRMISKYKCEGSLSVAKEWCTQWSCLTRWPPSASAKVPGLIDGNLCTHGSITILCLHHAQGG